VDKRDSPGHLSLPEPSTSSLIYDSSRFKFYFLFTCVVIRCLRLSFCREKAGMSESCVWMFVENVPLLFDKERVAKQLKVETWLDLIQLLKEIREFDADVKNSQKTAGYII